MSNPIQNAATKAFTKAEYSFSGPVEISQVGGKSIAAAAIAHTFAIADSRGYGPEYQKAFGAAYDAMSGLPRVTLDTGKGNSIA